MNRTQFKTFQDAPRLARVDARNFTPGTLLFGYTCERASFHVYRGTDGLIHRFVYRATDHSVETVSYDCAVLWDAAQLVPDKRVYPESTSLVMATVLRTLGVDVPYTAFVDSRYERVKDAVFHGRTKDDPA